MEKIKNTLKINFTDQGGKACSLSISDPMANVSSASVKAISDSIINNDLVLGEVGFLKNYSGASVITRTERAVE